MVAVGISIPRLENFLPSYPCRHLRVPCQILLNQVRLAQKETESMSMVNRLQNY